jgi:Mg2+ and Co2+ transporter CorA
MDKRPKTLVEMSPAEIRERLRLVNDEILRLSSNLNQIPKAFEESKQGDDDAVESEGSQQAFGDVRQRLADLRRELMELEARLSSKAA